MVNMTDDRNTQLKNAFTKYSDIKLDFNLTEKDFIQLEANFIYLNDLVNIDFHFNSENIIQKQKDSLEFYKTSIRFLEEEYQNILKERNLVDSILVEKKIQAFHDFINVLENI